MPNHEGAEVILRGVHFGFAVNGAVILMDAPISFCSFPRRSRQPAPKHPDQRLHCRLRPLRGQIPIKQILLEDFSPREAFRSEQRCRMGKRPLNREDPYGLVSMGETAQLPHLGTTDAPDSISIQSRRCPSCREPPPRPGGRSRPGRKYERRFGLKDSGALCSNRLLELLGGSAARQSPLASSMVDHVFSPLTALVCLVRRGSLSPIYSKRPSSFSYRPLLPFVGGE